MRLLLALALSLLFAGCTPRIRIEWNRPARFVLPVEQPLAINVEADGTAPTANTVVDAMIDIGQGQLLNKWLAVLPVRTELDAHLRRAGHRVVEPESAAVTVKVRPTRWSYNVARNGVGSGRIEAKIEVLDARNQPLFSDTYWATGGGGKIGEPEAMARASRELARAFLRTLQPSRVGAVVELDDSDPLTHPGIELCKNGEFDAAYMAFSKAVMVAPNSAPLFYDLGVLAHARGEYELAESMLSRAISLEPKALYFSALERVRRARQDAEGMKGT